MKSVALIVAAGRGTRASAHANRPKQYVRLAGQSLLAHTLGVFAAHPAIDGIKVVIHPDDVERYAQCSAGFGQQLLPPVFGGNTRQGSVRRGLDALAAIAPDYVLIHDAARPFVSPATITNVLDALTTAEGAIAAHPLSDTIKRESCENAGHIAATLERTGLWRAATPQGFRFDTIRRAHTLLASDPSVFTDDAAIAERAGINVALVMSNPDNFKITTAGDFTLAERYLTPPAADVRTGQGFDVHRFCDGDHVWLGGIKIAHTQSLMGHSDADVALHALTDAVLGAIGAGDIGQHFPPSDPQWRGAASDIFLADAAQRVSRRGARITNVDLTIICETPKIDPHRDAIRARLSAILELAPERINIKATTTETLGFTGRREGIAALATATVVL